MRPRVCWFRRRWLMIATAAVIVIGGRVRGAEPDPSDAGDPYPLLNCVVLDCPLYEDAEVFDVDDREIRVCCEECVRTFTGSPSTWIGVVDERIIRQETPYYPLTTCVVDGKPLDGFGTIDVVFRNRLFRLCGDGCREALEKEPAKHFDLLNKAVIKKQKPDYPLETCVVSGEPLGKGAVDHVVGNQLIRLAGPGQLDKFNEAPGKYLSELRKLAKEKPGKH